mmetsp:Transcript_66102/g.123302  ORF Transcript_66102/g.123302 Transcript_66102/m.123302 type:complete len:242 (-) Transcript_66102:20-745(-)
MACASGEHSGEPSDEHKEPLTRARAESYVLLNNISKRQNFGTLLRSASAFGVAEVFVVGAKKLSTHGNQGTTSHVRLTHFETLALAKAGMASRGIKLCGVEIADSALPVHTHPFEGPTCFMLGNEGEGMSSSQQAICDFFVYIPQYTGATASLNVAVAGAIVLHHFALWAGMSEQAREGEKFVTTPGRSAMDSFMHPTEAEKEVIEKKRSERAMKRQAAELSDDGAMQVQLDQDQGDDADM